MNLNSDSFILEVVILYKDKLNDRKDQKKKLLIDAAVKVLPSAAEATGNKS